MSSATGARTTHYTLHNTHCTLHTLSRLSLSPLALTLSLTQAVGTRRVLWFLRRCVLPRVNELAAAPAIADRGGAAASCDVVGCGWAIEPAVVENGPRGCPRLCGASALRVVLLDSRNLQLSNKLG